MGRRLTLHIGITKTGTTAIQHCLAQHRRDLNSLGICYPVSPGRIGHHLAAAIAIDERFLASFHPLMWEGLPPSTRLELFREQFASEMQALPTSIKHCVLSSERICSLGSEKEIGKLAEFLMPFFSGVKVIVYVRRQDQHFASNYTQNLRSGVLTRPELPKTRPLTPVQQATLDYHALMTRFENVFGKDTVVPRIFDKDELKDGDVVADFLHVAGIELVPSRSDVTPPSNTGLDIAGQSLLSAAIRWSEGKKGRTNIDPVVWHRFTETVNRTFAGRGWLPSRREAENMLNMFAQSNERVRRKYFPGRSTLFNSDLSNLPEHAEMPSPENALEPALKVIMSIYADWAKREVTVAMEKYRLARRWDDKAAMSTALKDAIKFDPEAPAPRLRMAEFCIEEGRLSEAEEHARVAARVQPNHPETRRILAAAQTKSRQASPDPVKRRIGAKLSPAEPA